VILHAANERSTHARYYVGILAVCTGVDDGIVGIVVDVQHRRIRDVDPERSAFDRRKPSLFVSQSGITGCANRHLWWKQ
jgi:hypothetical protein